MDRARNRDRGVLGSFNFLVQPVGAVAATSSQRLLLPSKLLLVLAVPLLREHLRDERLLFLFLMGDSGGLRWLGTGWRLHHYRLVQPLIVILSHTLIIALSDGLGQAGLHLLGHVLRR